MLIPLVAQQLRLLVRQKADSDPSAQGLNLPTDPHATLLVPPDSVVEVSKGARYQLFRALRAMSKGQLMLVEWKIPALEGYLQDSPKLARLMLSLNDRSRWIGAKDVEPVLVPGTGHPDIIGRVLIRAGWCAPTEQAHWVPNLRFFYLTDLGRESFVKAQVWWSGLTAIERLRLMLLE